MAPEAASGRHPGACTLTNAQAPVHTRVRADTPSHEQTPIRAHAAPHSLLPPGAWSEGRARLHPAPLPHPRSGENGIPGGGALPLAGLSCQGPERARRVGDDRLSTYCVPSPAWCCLHLMAWRVPVLPVWPRSGRISTPGPSFSPSKMSPISSR